MGHDANHMPAESKAASPRRFFHDFRGLRLSGLEWGRPGGKAVVMLHGGLENAHAWGPVAERLGAASQKAGQMGTGWRIIAPDLRGHGESGWAPGSDYGTFDFVCDLAAMLQFHGLDQIMLVGHSLGGAVASHFAALYPEKADKLCVIEGLRPASKTNPADAEEQINAIRKWTDQAVARPERRSRIYADQQAMIARLQEADPLLPPELAARLALTNIRETEGGYCWKYDPHVRNQSLLGLIGPEPAAFWQKITCKTLLVYGAQSWATNPAEDGRLAQFAKARVEVVADAGHNLHHHQTDAFCTLLADFLSGA